MRQSNIIYLSLLWLSDNQRNKKLSQNKWIKKAVADILRASICCQGTLIKSKSSYGCFGQIERLWNNREHILSLNKFFERNMMNDKINQDL
jgi:hypothetical protein